MSVFKKAYLDMNHHQRHQHDLEEARVSLHKAGKQLEDHLFDVSQDRARIKMLRERIARLEASYASLPAAPEQMSWVRKVVLYVRDAFATRNEGSNSVGKFQIVGSSTASYAYFCSHINENKWVPCTQEEYLELQEDPLYDLFKGPFGLTPPPLSNAMLYKPKGCASEGGSWALCSDTFYRANKTNRELDFVAASE